MSVAEIVLGIGLILLALAVLAIAMWMIYRIGLYIAFNLYGERLGISKEDD